MLVQRVNWSKKGFRSLETSSTESTASFAEMTGGFRPPPNDPEAMIRRPDESLGNSIVASMVGGCQERVP